MTKKKIKKKKPGHFGGLYGGMILSPQFGNIQLQEGGDLTTTSTGGVSGVVATGGGE